VKSIGVPRYLITLFFVVPILLFVFTSAVTVIPGSQAEYCRHWLFFYLPIFFFPALFYIGYILGNRNMFGLATLLILVGLYYPKASIISYKLIAPKNIIQGSNNRQSYVNSGKWFPYCELHSVIYINYVVNGIHFSEKPRDMFRVNDRKDIKFLFVSKNNPREVLVSNDFFVFPEQRMLVGFGVCCVIVGAFRGRLSNRLARRQRGRSSQSGSQEANFLRSHFS
jgi:hypothetical protein